MSGEKENPALEPTLKTSGNHEPTVEEINQLMATAQKDPLVGTKLAGGRYEILEVLGSGGMSVVYKAKQELVDRIVAVKTLKVHLLNDPTLIQRFDREVKTLSKLNHPNIVTVYDCVLSESGQPYFVMDYLNGQTLQEVIAAKGRLPLKRARDIFMQICAAVDHAHRQGVVHRDLKPANIMLIDLGTQEHVKVVDFGLAKLGEESQRLTQTGELWGSPLYMSPEQCSGYSLDARSDIYSLGTVMYETLTGKVPFRGQSFLETINMQMHEPPPHFSEIEPGLSLPPEIEEVVFRAMAKNPEKRFESMSELRTAIQNSFPTAVETPLLEPVEQPFMSAPQKKATTNGAAPKKPASAATELPPAPTATPKNSAIAKHQSQPAKTAKMLVPVAVAAGVIAVAGAGLWFWSSFGGKKNAPTGQTFDANSVARPAPAATPKTASPVTASPIDSAGSLPNPADESTSTALPSKPLAIAPVTPHKVPIAPATAATKSAHAIISAKKPSPAAQKHPKLTKVPPAQYKPIYHEAGSSVYHAHQSSDAIRDNEVWADKFSH